MMKETHKLKPLLLLCISVFVKPWGGGGSSQGNQTNLLTITVEVARQASTPESVTLKTVPFIHSAPFGEMIHYIYQEIYHQEINYSRLPMSNYSRDKHLPWLQPTGILAF